MFPLKPGRKTPAIRDWEGRASHEPNPAWWPIEDQGTGIACGPSRLVVIDLDPPSGLTSWARLMADHEATSTYTTETPRGGLHLYFDNSDGNAIRNSASKLGEGIDVRGAGGYVVAYDPIWDTEVQQIPDWLVELTMPPPPRRRVDVPRPASPYRQRRGTGAGYGLVALDAECDKVAAAPNGTRNHTLNRASFKVGQLISGENLDRKTAEDRLTAAALAAGLNDEETAKTIHSGLESGIQNPRNRR